MFRSWAAGQKAKISIGSTTLSAHDEEQALAQAMAAAMHIMNDDLEAAEEGLRGGESAFHKLGRGVIAFLRAALGFEKDVMKEAQEYLSAAEVQALKEQRVVQKEADAFRSSIYEPGTEYSLTHAQCLLMGAVVGVLNESLTEALRGFYNLRKAYMTLSTIIDSEERYLQKKPGSRASTQNFTASAVSTQPNSVTASTTDVSSTGPAIEPNGWDVVAKSDLDEDEDDDAFEDAVETVEQAITPLEYQGKTETHGIQKDLSDLHVSNSEPNIAASQLHVPSQGLQVASSAGTSSTNLKSKVESQGLVSTTRPPSITNSVPESDIFTHPIDVYIHSGANFCFGMLLIMLSMIPPAFGRLLSIIGFRGDRERGLRLLWKASHFPNINGAMAGLVLLVFYSGIIGFCDIIPDSSPENSDDSVENIEGYPLHRLEALLASLRSRYPKSGLWKLEEARMLAAKQRIDEALPMLSGRLDSPLKQVNALAVFERALQCMYSHRFEMCADSFIACVKLNNWSHALYFYLAGAAHVESYRTAIKDGDDTGAKSAAAKAVSYFGQVHENAGKRKFMARQMPFEVYCMRKLDKWSERAKEWGVPMIEAIGPSPLEEMIFHWNGYKKMTPEMLKRSLESLRWSEEQDKHWSRHHTDEKATLSLLRAVTLIALKDFDKSREILRSEVLAYDRSEFTGGLRDDWVLPVAHYETAVILWQTRTSVGTTDESNDHNRANIKEAQAEIDQVKGWGTYILDARVGMRVTAAEGTLKKWKANHGQ